MAPEKPLTEGAEALKAIVERPTKTELAERLGVSKQALDQWLQGQSRPTSHRREIIERVLGIPAAAWLTDDERAELAALGVDQQAEGAA